MNVYSVLIKIIAEYEYTCKIVYSLGLKAYSNDTVCVETYVSNDI